MQHPSRRTLFALLVAGAFLALTATGVSRPRCFGAASRDPLHPCVNHALDHTISPSLDDVFLQPSAPCRPLRAAHPNVCTFGERREPRSRSFALVGDSHSVHWRAALTYVARRHGWKGYSIYRTACPFSVAVPPETRPRPDAPAPKRRCPQNAWDVIRWTNRQQPVSTVIVSEHPRRVIPTGGRSELDTEIDGYLHAWSRLPRSVKHIVVIRDVPTSVDGWQDCVARSLKRHGIPGIDCQNPRSKVELPDTAVMAAQRANSPRVSYVDMNNYFCDPDFCFPVIGGALVHKDGGHISRTYSETLGPYLDRAIAAALAG